MKIQLSIASLLLLGTAYCATEDAAADKVEALPYAGAFESDTYSGYLKVTDTKSLHYIFTQSLDNPTKDPVVFWFNGGPGCSSLLGFMQEHGPLVIDDGEAYVKRNPWPWNMRANMVYVESPALVGFSIGDPVKDKAQNDVQSGADAFTALTVFFERFPEFLKNDLYISGESYGGIYVPTLSYNIDQHNTKAKTGDTIYNLKGYMVGNGATNYEFDVWPSYNDVIWGKQMITSELHQAIKDEGCIQYFQDVKPAVMPGNCKTNWGYLIGNTTGSNVNWYDLYRKEYAGGLGASKTPEERIAKTTIDGEEREYVVGYTQEERCPWLKAWSTNKEGDSVNTLADFLSHYLNLDEVRTALHIPKTVQTWKPCAGADLDYTPNVKGSIWIYPLMRNRYKILFYTGDTDGAVPGWGTRQWIHKLGWGVSSATKPWFANDQFQGEITRYDGMDFASIHGVGHLAPQWKRFETTSLITAWIHDEPLYSFSNIIP